MVPPTEQGSSEETGPEKAWERKDGKGEIALSETTKLYALLTTSPESEELSFHGH